MRRKKLIIKSQNRTKEQKYKPIIVSFDGFYDQIFAT